MADELSSDDSGGEVEVVLDVSDTEETKPHKRKRKAKSASSKRKKVNQPQSVSEAEKLVLQLMG